MYVARVKKASRWRMACILRELAQQVTWAGRVLGWICCRCQLGPPVFTGSLDGFHWCSVLGDGQVKLLDHRGGEMAYIPPQVAIKILSSPGSLSKRKREPGNIGEGGGGGSNCGLLSEREPGNEV